MKSSIKIILADAQYITSVGLRYLISQTENLSVVDVVSDYSELEKSVELNQPDLIILDYNQPHSFYIEDIDKFSHTYPKVNILIISADDTSKSIRQVMKSAGVKGFLTKECREDELNNAIEAILKGGRFYCETVVDILMQEEKPEAKLSQKEKNFEQLTQREKEIVRLVADGLTTKKIAEKLFLSPYTVSTHRKNALSKLGINSVPELVKFVIELGQKTS